MTNALLALLFLTAQPAIVEVSPAGAISSPMAARDAVRKLRAAGEKGPIAVRFHGGTYWMNEPWVLEPQDSGTAEGPTVYEAVEGQRPVLSGGQRIVGWKEGNGVWSVVLPEVAQGKWWFQQLWVSGQRRTRCRTPNEGFLRMASKAPPAIEGGKAVPRDQTAFIYQGQDLQVWPDLAEAQVVVYHSWETSRLRVAEVRPGEHLVRFTGPAAWPFENWEKKQRYYIENVRAALDAPGEWHLDRASGTLSYLPLPGEDMAKVEVIAPRLTSLVELRGQPDAGNFVSHVTLRGLALHHEDFVLEPTGHSDPQAVVTAPAAVMADGARHCALEGCEIAHTGDYALWLRRGCQDCRVAKNRMFDLGVGGVRIGEAAMPPSDQTESSRNLVDNNHLFDGGHVYPAGVGVWVAQSSHNRIEHNEIHGFRYSGMSIGWNWDDAPNRCHHNTIAWNHVHHVVNRVLSDAGAIYTLGVSPGSVIRNNVFHDVWAYENPPFGWGVYLDATTGGYTVENNVVYNIHSGCLMYSNGGHENVVRNNIFARGANHTLWPFWEKRPNTFRQNIVYMTQGTLFVPFTEGTLRQRLADKEPLGDWNQNLYWHAGGEMQFFRHDFAEWQALGLDRDSRIADPKFANPAAGDFRLAADSPALALGFTPIDTSSVGLYGDPEWVREGRAAARAPGAYAPGSHAPGSTTELPPPPPPPGPKEVADDFETTPVGASPNDANAGGEDRGASIRVSDEQAAGGKHSLKVIDKAGIQPSWQPHFFYEPHLTTGTVRQAFDVRLAPGNLFFTEWRDDTAYPGCIGPSVTLDGTGRVMVAGKTLATVPVGKWVRFEIVAALGKGSRKYTLQVTPAGSPTLTFADLPFAGDRFRELHWLGFVSTAEVDTAFYLDNLEIKRVK